MIVAQIGIATCGVAAVWLSQEQRLERRRWACILGLAGQPFWFAETISAGQWGIVALSVLYAWGWWRGFVVHWLRRAQA